SICSGGRYDNLAEYYTEKQLPGVGISIGLTRLFFVLQDQKMLNTQFVTAPADVLILPMTEDLAPAIAFATALRSAGIRAQLHCEAKKFKQKLSYADKLGVPYAAFLGEDEISAGTVTLKNLTMANDFSTEALAALEAEGIYKQITLPYDRAVAYLRDRLDAAPIECPILDGGHLAQKYNLEKPVKAEPMGD
ncbi:MAG: His/Gly/Thr/Pro-type tRNA ligase C-terminal domain-containing protein, partial [Pseudoflavonifractor sp.]